jgi:hypothetical protein
MYGVFLIKKSLRSHFTNSVHTIRSLAAYFWSLNIVKLYKHRSKYQTTDHQSLHNQSYSNKFKAKKSVYK